MCLLKKYLLLSTYFLLSLGSVIAGQPKDPYQQIDPDLVTKVNDAKEKQLAGVDLDQAESVLLEVLKTKPDYYRALYNLGLIYQSKGAISKAIDFLKRAETVRDAQQIHDNSILNSLGWIYLNAGDLERAETYLKDAYDKKDANDASTNERVLNNLGSLYLQKGETQSARRFLQESVSEFQSATAINLLKVVSDYERRQNQTQTAAPMWAFLGDQTKSDGNWTERYFETEGKRDQGAPTVNDTVIAIANVYVRAKLPVWDATLNDYVFGSIIGYIKPNDRLRVLETMDCNAANPQTKDRWFWIRVERSPKK